MGFLLYLIVGNYAQYLFQNNKHLIKGYLERFLCLLKNEEFDWDGGWITKAGIDFFNNLIKSSG